MTLYEAIKEEWSKVDMDMTMPPHIQPLETRARQLDDKLSECFVDFIQMWKDGCISATELLDNLVAIANTEIKE